MGETPTLARYFAICNGRHWDRQEGMETMKEYLNLREGQSISTNSLCDLARIILTEFYFKIGTDMYHQKVVTVIDTKSAPP